MSFAALLALCGRAFVGRCALTVMVFMLLVTQAKAENYSLPANPPNLSNLINVLRATPEGNWVRVNQNLFSDVWTPVDLRPGFGGPWAIINAWASFAWDPNRGDLIIFGGGHANYGGNDVYRWRGTTGLWERASLPSDLFLVNAAASLYETIDGPDHAPISSHTYDNNVFLPKLDRFLTFGGAAYNTGGRWVRQLPDGSSRITGPYLFDPSLADGNKVGGITGSNVQRVPPFQNIVGGNMWSNRDSYITIPDYYPPVSFVDGKTAYAEENGKDVVYVVARPGGTAAYLYRYSISNLSDPSADLWTLVGDLLRRRHG